MPCFVVFLRAINVGGHNVVKGTLQDAFSSLGFSNVSTFKQSGNVVFETEVADPEEIKAKVKQKLCLVLGYEVGVFVRTPSQLKKLLKTEPFQRKEETDVTFQVTFLEKALESFPLKLPLTIPNSTAEIISTQGTEVFSVTRGHGDGGKPNPFLESKLKMQATTRNWNVVSEIVKKCSENQ